jgi:hypothetical protein
MRKTIYNWLSGIVLLSILFCGFSTSMAQGTVVKGSTTLKVASGTTIVEPTKLTVESGATVDNSGTIILKGNLVNQNVSQSNLGSGTLELSGTLHQYIVGLNKVNNVTVNNSKGVGISGNTEIDGTLTLTSGLVTLGSNNLLLGPNASVSGTPSATKMVVATESGLLQKQFTDGTSVARSFTYPVGDSTGTAAEYSPVTLSFTTSNFATGIAGVNLVNSAYTGMTGDYLNRYWTTSSSGITSLNCNAQFNYVVADVNGTEANINCLMVLPDQNTYDAADPSHFLTASGLTALGTFTGGVGAVQTAFTVFLEGANNGAGSMTAVLSSFTAGDPYYSTSPFPLTQPYSASPWNYSGTENVGSVPANVVDWVYIELRSADIPDNATAATIFGKRAAFLKSDGSIVDIDGTSPVKFTYGTPSGPNVYVVIKHRNHLAIMSSSGVLKNGSGVYIYDFTDAGTKTYGYPDGIKMKGGKWSMVGGNGYPNDLLDTDDLSYSWNSQFGYYDGYFNMSGLVDTDDLSYIWNINFGDFDDITDQPIHHGYRSMVP